jgi:superfamily II DNA or RNA helicase
VLIVRLSNAATIRRVENPVFNPADLITRFTYPNPKHAQNERLGFSNYGVPRDICLGELTCDSLTFPRGLVSEILNTYPGVEIIEETCVNPIAFNPSRIIPRDYQRDALTSLLRKNQGVFVSPPGSGKTVVGIELILQRRQRALVLVHTLDLLTQWQDRVRQFTDIEPGIIQRDRFDVRGITIGMVQALTRPLDEEFTHQFGLVLLDESHHASAATFQQLVDQFPAKYRYGLTATPERQDGLAFIMTAVMGRILHEVRPAALVSNGNIMEPTIRIVETTAYVPVVESYQELLAKLIKDRTRNRLIVSLIAREAKAGHFCLVLSERVRHARELHRVFTEQDPGITAFVITGQDTKETRQQAIDALNEGAGSVLFSTRLADEGLDIRRLDRLFLTCPVRAAGKVRQQIGRIQRTFPGKGDAIVYDFVDMNSLSESQLETRQRCVYTDWRTEHIGYKDELTNHEEAA